MSSAPLLYESHSHTPLCNHAFGEPEDYAAVAQRRGFKGLIVTCHCPLPDGVSAEVRMTPDQYETYLEMIARARQAFAGRVDVRAGLESDYFPGIESWLEALHARAPLHHVLGSVHMQMHHYRTKYFTGDYFAYQQLYFEHLAQAAETGLFDTLAHPDLVKNENPREWRFGRIQPFIERALDRIAATGVAMELNTSGLQKALAEMNPGRSMLELMFARGIPVVIGADAHRPDRVGDNYVGAMRILRSVGYEHIHYFLERKRHTVTIADALASLGVPA